MGILGFIFTLGLAGAGTKYLVHDRPIQKREEEEKKYQEKYGTPPGECIHGMDKKACWDCCNWH